ncbi:MAG: lytic transglycosylase domain-containing protein [Candidatus Caenarcaniphilales bacterium]|nr:lytic transglycosylase domain-containing protein [Candidatus Caenarcaniphilales bacterium]
MNGSSLESINRVLQRITSIDQRIDQIEGKEIKSSSPKKKESSDNQVSFASVLGQIREKLPTRANKWIVEDAIEQAAKQTNLDADLIRAVVEVESGGNSSAVSGAGAKGLMQLIDSTAQDLGVQDSFDPHQNALGGASYLKKQLNRFGGNLRLALAAYNAGPEAVAKYQGIPPYNETINYVQSVEAHYRKRKIS